MLQLVQCQSLCCFAPRCRYFFVSPVHFQKSIWLATEETSQVVAVLRIPCPRAACQSPPSSRYCSMDRRSAADPTFPDRNTPNTLVAPPTPSSSCSNGLFSCTRLRKVEDELRQEQKLAMGTRKRGQRRGVPPRTTR